jgi:hypothetical protein
MAFRDLQSRRLIIAKGLLFALLGFGAAALVVMEDGAWWRCLLLLAVCVWAFCRAYYFAFYVIEHYVDSRYRYSGLFSAVRFLLRPPEQRSDAEDHSNRGG